MIALPKAITVCCTSHDWELGIQVTIPSTSKHFHDGVKLRMPFGVTVYLGPVSIDFRGDMKIIAFLCASCRFIHTGEPAWSGPMPGLNICDACREKAKREGSVFNVSLHGDECDGHCGMGHSDHEVE